MKKTLQLPCALVLAGACALAFSACHPDRANSLSGDDGGTATSGMTGIGSPNTSGQQPGTLASSRPDDGAGMNGPSSLGDSTARGYNSGSATSGGTVSGTTSAPAHQ
jgi:hypothetical protein